MNGIPRHSTPPYSSFTWKMLFIGCLLIASIFPIQIVPSAERVRPGSDGQFSGKQGNALWIEVPVPDPKSSVSGTFLKREVPFFNHTGTSFAGIVGIDMEDPPGLQELHVQIMTETGTSHLSYSILIIEEDYAVQHLTLPKDKVDLNATVLARVREEQKELTEAFRH